MTKLGSTPPGAENDPHAPYNEPDYYSEWGEEIPPTCWGCDSEEVEYYEYTYGTYHFWCQKCVIEAWLESPWQAFKEFIDDHNIKPIQL